MASRTDFSAEEWSVLRTAPALVGGAMMAATPDGFFASMREAFSMGSSSFATLKAYQDVALLKEIMTDKDQLVDEMKAKLGTGGTPAERRARLQSEALAGVKQAVAILQAKGGPDDLKAYRGWVGAVAEGVANAASSGGVLGFGGEKVSEAEKAFLGQVMAAMA
jgi:hypothetical protein